MGMIANGTSTGEPSKKPSEASKKPSEASKKASEASKKPSEASKKPSEASKKPSEASKKSGVSNQTYLKYGAAGLCIIAVIVAIVCKYCGKDDDNEFHNMDTTNHVNTV